MRNRRPIYTLASTLKETQCLRLSPLCCALLSTARGRQWVDLDNANITAITPRKSIENAGRRRSGLPRRGIGYASAVAERSPNISLNPATAVEQPSRHAVLPAARRTANPSETRPRRRVSAVKYGSSGGTRIAVKCAAIVGCASKPITPWEIKYINVPTATGGLGTVGRKRRPKSSASAAPCVNFATGCIHRKLGASRNTQQRQRSART